MHNPNRHTPWRASRTQRGFTMIEVLIAVFVLAVGLVSMAALQVTSKKSNNEAAQRATATTLVQDLVERMRTNFAALDTYTGDGTGRTLTGATMAAVDCVSATCTTAQMANFDLYEFEQALAGVAERSAGGTNLGGLLLPTACISGAGGGSGFYTVAVAWRGMTKLSNPTINNCGAGSGRYDYSGGGADLFRRVLQAQTYIVVPF